MIDRKKIYFGCTNWPYLKKTAWEPRYRGNADTGINCQRNTTMGLYEDTIKKNRAVSYLVQTPLKKKRA